MMCINSGKVLGISNSFEAPIGKANATLRPKCDNSALRNEFMTLS